MIVRILLIASFLYIPVSHAGWRMYINKKYGFTISYPAYLVTNHQFSRGYLLGTAWSINDYDKNNAYQHSLFEIQLQNSAGMAKGEEYYYRVYVRIGMSTLPSDIANCQKATNSFKPASSPSRIIGNKKFYLFDFSDAAMSQYNLGTSYRLLNKGNCYSIEYIETGLNRENIPNYKTMSKKNRILATKIINTFRLNNERKK